MAIEFGHIALAELHNLHIRLALGVEVGATLTATHRECGEGVFKCLLKCKEFQNTKIYARVETDTTLVGAYRAIHLHTIATIDLHLALVVNPRHAEDNHTLRLGYTLQNLHLAQMGTRNKMGCQTLDNLAYCLMELLFTGVLCDDFGHKIIYILFLLICHNLTRLVICVYSVSNIVILLFFCNSYSFYIISVRSADCYRKTQEYLHIKPNYSNLYSILNQIPLIG